MESPTPQTREVAPPDEKPRRWRDRWPVLIPLVLIGGLLWIGLWYSRRAALLEEASHVEFEAPTWAWLEMFAGPEVRSLIGSPSSLHLGGERPTASQLRLVAGMDELTEFAAGGMTDTDLECLADCTKLESLQLHRSSITDAGMQSLARFRQLEHLNINTDQPLTNEALSPMEHCRQLNTVWIETPRISNLSLVPFGSLRKLEHLTLSGAQIRGDTLAPLTKLPGLRRLGLRNCQIGVEALAALRPSLSGPRLFLDGSDVTDQHIPALEQLTWLLTVSFGNTQVSDQACRRLKQARPGIEIYNARGDRVPLPDGSD